MNQYLAKAEQYVTYAANVAANVAESTLGALDTFADILFDQISPMSTAVKKGTNEPAVDHQAVLDFVKKDLHKEKYQDSKLSINETISICKKAGFRNPQLVWQTNLGTTGLFYMKK